MPPDTPPGGGPLVVQFLDPGSSGGSPAPGEGTRGGQVYYSVIIPPSSRYPQDPRRPPDIPRDPKLGQPQPSLFVSSHHPPRPHSHFINSFQSSIRFPSARRTQHTVFHEGRVGSKGSSSDTCVCGSVLESQDHWEPGGSLLHVWKSLEREI